MALNNDLVFWFRLGFRVAKPYIRSPPTNLDQTTEGKKESLTKGYEEEEEEPQNLVSHHEG